MDKETSEIAKLTERIAKDPRSKLFVPLAEEYKKSGDLEMAIHVLTEGLKNNPGYVTARSFLGKLFIEKSDLPAAQREFEEVVKAIPDNLMAQRKLGDLYAVQNKPADALRHYRTVLTLNPKDSETAMLIAETEAGRDITKHLALAKVAAAAALEAEKVQKAPPASPQPRSEHTAQNRAKSGQAAAAAQEEPEEVLMVEPLEEVVPALPAETAQKPAADLYFLDETMQAAVSSGERVDPSDEADANALFSLSEPIPVEERAGSTGSFPDAPFTLQDAVVQPEKQHEDNDAFAVEDPFAVREVFAADSGTAEPLFELNEPAGGHEEEAFIPADDADVVTAEILEEPEKQADDFTTDTLAELYISQGFFEKAVEIYERMLVDKPNSQGLKDKLANVRAMAAAAGQEAGLDAAASGEAGIPAEATEPGFIPSPHAAQPRLDDWELPASVAAPVPGEERRPRPRQQPKPFEVGFEPREYVPPDAIPRQSLPETNQTVDSAPREPELSVSRKPSDVRKKETVDRLESWLKNIIKEN